MKKFKESNPEQVNALTFDELIEYGKSNGANIVDGMPWSFKVGKMTNVSHETNDEYVIGNFENCYTMKRDSVLVLYPNDRAYVFSLDDFAKRYELI